ncbi:hypothetical protein EZ054_13565 [Enterococcus faecalis]|nr:hypothetical protein [Enterococcus faecalis]MUN83853.1 hypothetical protein [Enterococcus faecalis]
MGTRTAIFKEQADGTYQGIYCHWDGYIEGVGAVWFCCKVLNLLSNKVE